VEGARQGYFLADCIKNMTVLGVLTRKRKKCCDPASKLFIKPTARISNIELRWMFCSTDV
jgi:hypothetical protein